MVVIVVVKKAERREREREMYKVNQKEKEKERERERKKRKKREEASHDPPHLFILSSRTPNEERRGSDGMQWQHAEWAAATLELDGDEMGGVGQAAAHFCIWMQRSEGEQASVDGMRGG